MSRDVPGHQSNIFRRQRERCDPLVAQFQDPCDRGNRQLRIALDASDHQSPGAPSIRNTSAVFSKWGGWDSPTTCEAARAGFKSLAIG